MWFVYLKELRELVRDKKTLFFIIFLPLLIFPLLIFVMGGIVANITYDQQQQVLKYHLINAEAAPEFADKLKYHRDFKPAETDLPTSVSNNISSHTLSNVSNIVATTEELTNSTDAIADMQNKIKIAIQSGELDIVIVVNSQHQQAIKDKKQDQWQVYFNNASQLNFVHRKFNHVFNQYRDQVQNKYLYKAKITPELFALYSKPINIETVNTASERETVGEQIGGILPYLLIMLCLTGAMYPAIDLGAGEKERKTLEPLLQCATPLHYIVLGKFLTIMTTGIITALISVFSVYMWGSLLTHFINSNVINEVSALFSLQDVMAILLMILPTSALFAAILLSISIYARSFKEAQNYMGLVTMSALFPVMFAMIPGVKLDWFWACIPITNVALAIKELVKGTVDYYMVATIFASSLFFACISIILCVFWFKKESVLHR